MEKKWFKNKGFYQGIVILMLVLFFCANFFLFYMQLQENGGKYSSDLPLHVIAAASENIAGYSLLFYVFDFFYTLPMGSAVLTAGLVAFFSTGTIIALYLLFQVLQPHLDGSKKSHWLLAFASSFIMALYFPGLTNRYLGTFSPSIWHNSTYIAMRFFAVVSLIAYFSLNKKYMEKINWKAWAVLAVSCALATAIKPSFAVCFLPIMAIFLLRDWIKNNFKGFKNIFLFGLSAIPSVLIGLLQATILSNAEYTSQIAFMRVLHVFSAHPYISIFVSVVFPLLAFLLIGKYLYQFEDVKMLLFAFLLGVVQAVLITETGKASNDGNYIWGALVMNYFLFAVVALRSWQWCKEKLKKGSPKKAGDIIIAILLWGSFSLHVLSGIKYFILILQGGHFL